MAAGDVVVVVVDVVVAAAAASAAAVRVSCCFRFWFFSSSGSFSLSIFRKINKAVVRRPIIYFWKGFSVCWADIFVSGVEVGRGGEGGCHLSQDQKKITDSAGHR